MDIQVVPRLFQEENPGKSINLFEFMTYDLGSDFKRGIPNIGIWSIL